MNARVKSLQNDVANLVHFGEKVTGDDNYASTYVNQQLDLYFTRCQALLDEMDRFNEPYLYFQLLSLYRQLFGLFQKWG